MNTKLGKSFGLAFVVAVGILALMFALGTFNAQQAGAQDDDTPPTLAVNDVDLAVDGKGSVGIPVGTETIVTLTFSSSRALGENDQIDVTLTGFPEASAAVGVTADITGVLDDAGEPVAKASQAINTNGDEGEQPLTIMLTLSDDENIPVDTTVTVTIGDETDDSGLDTGDAAGVIKAGVEVTDDLDNEGSETETDDADADSTDVSFGVLLDTDTVSAGAESYVSVEVGTATTGADGAGILALTTGLINSGDRITIDLESFGLPDSIDTEDVSIRGLTTTGAQVQRGEPESVRISGSEVTLIVPDMSEAEGDQSLSPRYRVVFNTEAGVTIPSTAGNHFVSWENSDGDDIESNTITVLTSLTPDPKKGDRDTEITLKGRAWPTGTTGIYWVKGSNEKFIQDVNASDGAFDLALTPTADFEPGENTIRAIGADGIKMVETTFELLGTVAVSPQTVDKGGILKITLTDWSTGNVAKAKIGGEDVERVTDTGEPESYPVVTIGAEPEDGFVFWVKVGEDVRLGSKTLTLLNIDDERLGSTDIEIGALSLSVTPTAAVAGQQVTVSGSGFARSATITGTVQSKMAIFPSDSDEATSSGRITVTFTIPAGVTHGTRTIEITDSKSNVGQVSLTVPEPAVTVDPKSSKRGSQLTVSGSGFPADESITVEYDEGSGRSVRSDGTGSWTTTFAVPSNAGIGEEAKIKATGEAGGENYVADTTHSVPPQTITLGSETASSGSTLTISGDGFPRFASVKVVFGSHDETSLGVNTDDNGSFPATSVLVPGLDDGIIIVRVTVSGITATELLEIVPTPVITTKPSADVFADLIAMDNLIVVWYFDNDTKGWSFYDPRPAVAAAVDLNEVSSGDIVWIQITADQDFPGATPSDLSAGWNQVTIN